MQTNDPDDPKSPGCAGLLPWTIVALGTPSRPVDRAIGLQSAVYRLIVAIGDLRLPSLSRPAARYPGFRSAPGRSART
jgi:hypothetical protein